MAKRYIIKCNWNYLIIQEFELVDFGGITEGTLS